MVRDGAFTVPQFSTRSEFVEHLSRAVTTHFIINLAFADLLTGIFAIPFKFQAALFQIFWSNPVWPESCAISYQSNGTSDFKKDDFQSNIFLFPLFTCSRALVGN
ncbi:hypothetical protein DICVIV_08878 [Dictyocaulus viviparus]|uniref:Uncharacterized protein n=1 Tax=Dictyocaulus viviparus TaxID=29172 RepID=A0A0D8XRP7_DICVI|nr:hypothetical protein DICVIV_08878 [Dictyocaulus viviparus]